jgi:hypothetical protein
LQESAPAPFRLSLVADHGGLPTGAALESFLAIACPAPAVGTVQSLTHPALLAGQRYWLVADSQYHYPSPMVDLFGWNYSTQPAGLPTGYQTDAITFSGGPFHGPWQIGTDSSAEFALRVDGTRLQNAPEPSALALAALGLTGLALRGLRARRRFPTGSKVGTQGHWS